MGEKYSCLLEDKFEFILFLLSSMENGPDMILLSSIYNLFLIDYLLAFSIPESAFFEKSAGQEVGGQGLVEEEQWLR